MITLTPPTFAPLPPKQPCPPQIEWDAVVTELAKRPGEWAQIGTLPGRQSMGNRGVRLRERGVLTQTRTNGDGTATVWACYVGNEGAAFRRVNDYDRQWRTKMPAPMVWGAAS